MSGSRNVELLAAKDIGQVTLICVRNIYKYYVAYKLALEEGKLSHVNGGSDARDWSLGQCAAFANRPPVVGVAAHWLDP